MMKKQCVQRELRRISFFTQKSTDGLNKTTRARAILFALFSFSGVCFVSPIGKSLPQAVLQGAALLSLFGFSVAVIMSFKARAIEQKWRTRKSLQERIVGLFPENRYIAPAEFSLDIPSGHNRAIARDLELFSDGSLFLRLIQLASADSQQEVFDRLSLGSLSETELRDRQQRVRFWEQRTLVRRHLLREIIQQQKISHRTEVQIPLVQMQGQCALFLLGLVTLCHLLVLTGFLLSQQWLANVSFLALLFTLAWGLRKVDWQRAYPVAMTMAKELHRIQLLFSALVKLNALERSGYNSDRIQSLKSVVELDQSSEQCVSALGLRQNPILAVIINLIIPWDFYWTLRTEKIRQQLSASFNDWKAWSAEIEADLIFAEWSHTCGGVWPEITSNRFEFQAQELGHPMIPYQTRVCNDVELSAVQRCHLITGSNMAGKSTFLKTITLNLVLAQAGAKVIAQYFKLGPFRVVTSLRSNDNLSEGASSFYAEVREIAELIKRAEKTNEVQFYLIDEVFKGTNNKERRIGAESVLKKLSASSAIGFVTTHDLDLGRLSEELSALKCYHFRDFIQDGKMSFDFKYREGVCPTTNALVVMKNAGLGDWAN